MKIADILKEQDWKQDTPSFKTKQTEFDPKTGQYTWDVDYTPIKGVDNAIEKAYQEYKEILKDYPEDQKLEKLFDVFASFKKAFRTHVSRKYSR
jgi:hypothetical protein|tara:strand:- start:3233 stop:3514 length:282 start_codon:yes stop_codon:yes gene_type:complete